ncbi:uncharacterized protein LOC135848421 [Planococcus citri]|uniref:uncharacterized protein LOC135848421 n=1 Tax=Planococcus citri TaxID=170843 RepID=UPI0031F9D9D2
MSTVLSYLRSGKSVNVDDDDSSSDKRKSSAEFRGFSEKEKPEQSIPKSKGKSKVTLQHVSESTGDTEAGTSSAGSGDISNDPSIPVDPVPPPSNPSSGPPPPPPPGPSDDESEGSESSDDESDDAVVSDNESNSSSDDSMFGAGDNRVMESMVFRGTGFVSWKRKIKVILSAKGLQTAILQVNSLSPRKKAKALKILIRHVAENVFRLVKETEDPYVFWTELNSLYQAENQAAIIDCRTRISKIVIDMYKSPKEFLEAFYTLVNDMESLDVKLTPSEVYTYLINALGNSPKYESVRMTARGLVHVTAGDPNPKVISSLLLSLEDASKNSSTSKGSTSTGSAMAASDQSGNNNKRNRNHNKSRSSNSNLSGNSSNGNGERNGGSGFVQAKDRTCYKCHKRGHMAKSCRSAGGNYRNDTNPRGSIVCYRCNLTGHIGRNCPQNGDSSRNNGGNGSSSGTSGTSGPSGSSGSSGPRPSLALGLSSPFSEKKKNLSLDDRRRSNVVDEFVKSNVGRSSFGDSVAISNFGNSTALNLGEENAYVETNNDDGVDFITFVVDSGATSHFLKHRGVLHDERKINESLQSAHCEVSLIKEGGCLANGIG